MPEKATKRTQVVFMLDPDLRRAIRRESAETDRSQSDVVNDRLRRSFKSNKTQAAATEGAA